MSLASAALVIAVLGLVVYLLASLIYLMAAPSEEQTGLEEA
jgi:predicted membrane channel-forming protein YqfA (hemolysin III family)